MERLLTIVRGSYRFTVGLLLIIVAGISIVIAALPPGPRRGVTRSMRVIPPLARRIMKAVNVEIHCHNPEVISQHEGILVSNHISYVDVVALLTLTPLRFLAKAEIRRWPLIGLAAQAIGCVFVRRRSQQARAETRAELANMDRYPPIVIFPEGTRPVEPGLLALSLRRFSNCYRKWYSHPALRPGLPAGIGTETTPWRIYAPNNVAPDQPQRTNPAGHHPFRPDPTRFYPR
jgi:1-acyl-sn-glycerol-3-phosphate acyltransferase